MESQQWSRNKSLDWDDELSTQIRYRCRSVMMNCGAANAQPDYSRWLQCIASISGPEEVDGDADEVVGGLLLGGAADALDVEKLRGRGVTHVVNCAKSGFEELASPRLPNYADMQGVLAIDGRDDDNFDWSPHLKSTSEFIHQALDAGGRVLVHCLMGLNRSGMVTAAYLILRRRMSLVEAMALLRCKRSKHVLSNQAFLKQLICLSGKEGLLT